ncbi:MAG: DegT/DnrJ/EryC1/StrS aminotransferase family protein [Candidatus Tectomicrobia bacterium]|nr:DegT/DnrJ/EryC1/StrS aminotransferase family protein [Candidatus Tectomicrobia bacterium]
MTQRDALPFQRPCLGEAEAEAVREVLLSGWITTGPKTRAFEEAFAGFVRAPFALGLNSCTAGLHLALMAAGVQPGDEVITTPIGFAASANVIDHLGARAVFVDVRPQDLNLDVGRIEAAVTPSTRAILPVHLAGNPCDMAPLLELAQRLGLPVISDAAHATDAEYHGRRMGELGDYATFSFYATKPITTAEGGMLTTPHGEQLDWLRTLSLQGLSRDAWTRFGRDYQHWEIVVAGYKFNMFDVQAALGLVQLQRAEEFRRQRSRIAAIYDAAFTEIEELAPLRPLAGCTPSHHLYIVLLRPEAAGMTRDAFMNALQCEGIGVGVHFRALHLHPYYQQKFGYGAGLAPRAEAASKHILSLPLFNGMRERDAERVIDAVQRILRR